MWPLECKHWKCWRTMHTGWCMTDNEHSRITKAHSKLCSGKLKVIKLYILKIHSFFIPASKHFFSRQPEQNFLVCGSSLQLPSKLHVKTWKDIMEQMHVKILKDKMNKNWITVRDKYTQINVHFKWHTFLKKNKNSNRRTDAWTDERTDGPIILCPKFYLRA